MRVELPELTGGRCGSTVGFLIEREDFCNGYPVYSGSFFCTVCLTEWARLTWEEDAGNIPIRTYEIRGLVCTSCVKNARRALHPDLSPVPGSLGHNTTLNNYDVTLLEDLPEPLIKREFALHMEYFPNE
jgi:hypothetical protein